MGLFELLAVAVGLSMDAFAVALCKGLNMRRFEGRKAVVIALFFGCFQALMPLAGWLAGRQFERYIVSFDHWIAFALLAFIGGKMIWDALHEDDGENACPEKLDLGELLVLAVATSIDALAVGITFAFLQVEILPAVGLIGLTTFLLSLVGVLVGNRFGVKYKSRAEFAGGAVLILMGLKILLEHLGVLP